MKKTILTIVMAIFCSTNLFAGPEKHVMAPKPSSPEFIRIKELAGDWAGTHEMEGKTKEVNVKYEITSNGTAVVETLFAGTSEEMVSVYHDENGKLTMTHYCTLGNQPTMILDFAKDDSIKLSLEKNSSIGSKDPHMHSLEIELKDDSNIVHNWSYYEEGKNAGTTTVSLKRATA